ncbi:hypothetical protein HOS33_gp138 [Erwinia phage vB_EamM_Y3]|uniref:Uncharacterized protein n=1 Tax=Erwinia phage vB_EamM_Y3 TaxID=1983553 RepID=A0A2H4IB52_9CAUD|nr:hypothetical protein HOS33_gp138 [Erwinia phage vB_EamM_Y3]ARW58778.1 hypothetical protein Y3_138 [Erwinia phage vB_EamM_Y3]
MKTLSGSLAALALIAIRDGNWADAARLAAQAACAPDSDQFLECQLTENYEAQCLVDSFSSASGMTTAVTALSSALELDAEEERSESMYGDDEVDDINTDEESSDDDFDFGEDDEEADDENDEFIDSESSTLIRIRLD